ncbi:calcium-binding protein [Azospirillum sp. SYSU D00513]|uniref:calcium-binding protein n=1 Tax=Azospirillum sp. SYSU D00513 TaxID=2812561 RepID=UPI001A967144|nr:calcium-binding protein [Azospirillum sp. SYSU D00513]
MATVFANGRINLDGDEGATGIQWDNFYVTNDSATNVSWRYTLGGSPVFDVSMSGSFWNNYYGPYGNVSTLTATSPNGGMLFSVSGMDLSFWSLSDFESKLSMDYILRHSDYIVASSYDDGLYGYTGNDSILGKAGSDYIDGGSGSDVLYGNTDHDVLYGGDAADVLFGGLGHDALIGGSDNDGLFGGQGNDRLDGGYGNDDLRGGAGADTFLVRDWYGADRVLDFNPWEGDRIEMSPGQIYAVSSTSAGEAVLSLASGSTLTLLNFATPAFSSEWITYA